MSKVLSIIKRDQLQIPNRANFLGGRLHSSLASQTDAGGPGGYKRILTRVDTRLSFTYPVVDENAQGTKMTGTDKTVPIWTAKLPFFRSKNTFYSQ